MSKIEKQRRTGSRRKPSKAGHPIVTPRMTPYIKARPTPRQAAFLLVNQKEAFFGGAAGGGKSVALLMAALQYVDVPGYSALIVRLNFPQLSQPNGLIDMANRWLSRTDAIWIASEHQWRFPSGATLTFRHLSEMGAERNFQGSEYQFIGVDEVTDLGEDQYRFLFSRLRRPEGLQVPDRMRSASNPYGPGLDWVRRRLVMTRHPNRVFIAARLEDNPHLDQADYEESLRELGPIAYQQLRNGDWTVRPEGGLFRGEWFDGRFVERRELPERLELLRAWDLAATEARSGTDPDYTAGVLLGRTKEGVTYVLDVKRTRSTPLKVERLVRQTAEDDTAWAKEHGYQAPDIRIEQEPGSSGVSIVEHYRRSVLSEFTVKGIGSTGTKSSRAEPVAARAEAGELLVCAGPWNTPFVDELVIFPMGSHDDQVDALSLAFHELAKKKPYILCSPGGTWRESPWRI